MYRSLFLSLALLGAASNSDDALRSAVVLAGGGPGHFTTGALFRTLAGGLAGAEFAVGHVQEVGTANDLTHGQPGLLVDLAMGAVAPFGRNQAACSSE